MQAVTPQDLVKIVLQRKWWILASLVICVTVASVAWNFSPKKFKSTVVVTIDSPRIAKEYVKGLSQAQEGRYNEDPVAIVIQQVSLGLTNKSILMPVLETLKPYSDAEAEGQSSDQCRYIVHAHGSLYGSSGDGAFGCEDAGRQSHAP
jgi:uncharacterized protein involved in exopolysaccharide biosynthesis